MPDKMNGENHSLVRLFLKSGFMKELDLTKGSVLKTLLQFAVPFLIANLLQALYGGADLFVVGWFDDAASVAAVAIGSQVMQTITRIILGLTTGTTVVIAMATGAKNYRDVATSIGTSICLFASVGLFLMLIMVVFHNYIAVLMHTPVEAMRDAKHYLLICSIGIPFIMGYNVVCGILRGLGDSKTPLYFVALACVINIVLDVVLVGFCHLRAAGAAIATASSQGISFLTALWFLHKRGFHFPFFRRDIRLSPILSRRIFVLGAPIALQDALVNVSFLLITVIVNQMGVIASAALGVVEKIIVFAMLPPMAISSAVAASAGKGLFGLAEIATLVTTIISNMTAAIGIVNSAKFAKGGLVEGSGTGTSDSIPAMLSNGESVITARATSMFSPILSYINQAGGGAPIVVEKGSQAMGEDMIARAVAKGIKGIQPVVSVTEINKVGSQVNVVENLGDR